MTLQEVSILVGLIIAVLTLIGVVGRGVNKLVIVTHQIMEMRKLFFDGRTDDEKPLTETIEDMSAAIKRVDYDIRPNSSHSAHDRLYQRMDGIDESVRSLTGLMRDFLRIIQAEQDKLSNRLSQIEKVMEDERNGRFADSAHAG